MGTVPEPGRSTWRPKPQCHAAISPYGWTGTTDALLSALRPHICQCSVGYQSKDGAHHYRCEQEHQHHHAVDPCHRQPAKRTKYYRYPLLVYGSDMARHHTGVYRKTRSPGASTSDDYVPA